MNKLQPEIINLPKIDDPRGNLTFIEQENHIPFQIKRVYWVYDVPGGQTRGGTLSESRKSSSWPSAEASMLLSMTGKTSSAYT
jgi:hypothetical protein